MVSTRFEEGIEARSGESFFGWKCLLCGEVIDSRILANRKSHAEALPQRARVCRNFSVPAQSTGRKRKTRA
jgi:hypothetical protein